VPSDGLYRPEGLEGEISNRRKTGGSLELYLYMSTWSDAKVQSNFIFNILGYEDLFKIM
jgi:hypothetical protein